MIVSGFWRGEMGHDGLNFKNGMRSLADLDMVTASQYVGRPCT